MGSVSVSSQPDEPQQEHQQVEANGAGADGGGAAKTSALATLSSLASLSGGSSQALSDKEIKKIAFSLCQERYEEVLPVAAQLVELESALGEEREREGGRGGRGGGRGGGKKEKR